MAALKRVTQTQSTNCTTKQQFPDGLRVLVVDDDLTTLKILEQMCRICRYQVTIHNEATAALKLLRESNGCFDVVISDVHMPDMDGYKLLEHVGLEMDLPVIMMSADARIESVMKGIRHGACDYLIKPIRQEELRNIWQHVMRKKWNGNKEHENSGSQEDNDCHKHGNNDCEYASSVHDPTEETNKSTKRSHSSDGEKENDDPSKKRRVVWTVELHQKFVNAVNQLGPDKAVPKKILEVMGIPGLSRENVASHLQKFRIYLKRIRVELDKKNETPNTQSSSADLVKLGTPGNLDIQALVASGKLTPQMLAALNAELLGHPAGNLMPTPNPPPFVQTSLQGPECMPSEHGVSYVQPLVKCPSNVVKHFPHTIFAGGDVYSGYKGLPYNSISSVGPSNIRPRTYNSNVVMEVFQQQQQQQPRLLQRQQQHSTISEHSRSIDMQPSCLMIPSQSSGFFQAGNAPGTIDQNAPLIRDVMDYSILQPHLYNIPATTGQFSDVDLKPRSYPCNFAIGGANSLGSSSLVNAANSNSTLTLNAARQLVVPNMGNVQGSYGAKYGELPEQANLGNTEFDGDVSCMQSRPALGENESTVCEFNHVTEGASLGIPIQFSSTDLSNFLQE